VVNTPGDIYIPDRARDIFISKHNQLCVIQVNIPEEDVHVFRNFNVVWSANCTAFKCSNHYQAPRNLNFRLEKNQTRNLKYITSFEPNATKKWKPPFLNCESCKFNVWDLTKWTAGAASHGHHFFGPKRKYLKICSISLTADIFEMNFLHMSQSRYLSNISFRDTSSMLV